MQDYMYSVIGLIAIAIQLIINYKVMFIPESNYVRKAGKIYHSLMLSMLIYYITDALWGIFAGLNWISLLFIDTTVYYVAMSLIIVCFYRYFVDYLGMKDWKSKLFNLLGRIFFALEIIFLIINFFMPCFFWFDANDAYVAGPVRYIALWVQITMFAFSSLVTLIDALKTEGTSRRRYLAIFFFSLIMLIAIIFQEKYPLLPFYALGCLLGSCVLHVYVVGDEQDEAASRLSNYKQAILSDALIALEVNLSKDELYYGVWKDDDGNEISLKDMIDLELPCSYSQYQKNCNEKYVTANHDDFLDGTDTNRLLEAFNKGMMDVTYDYEAKTFSGKHTWLRRSVAMIRNQEGDIIAYTNVKDISSLVEQKVREDAYMRALATEYDSITIVEITNDDKHDDRVLIRGRLTERLATLIDEDTANEELFSRKLDKMLRFVHPDDREQFYAETRREKVVQANNENRTQIVNFRIINPSGDFFYYQLCFVPLRDESGKPTKVVAGMKNVDSEVRKEMKDRRELEAARYAAESANRAKTAFLFNMSHDIRTPMNAILGYTDVAIQHRDNQIKVDDSLKKIKLAGSHLLDLINDILEMSRIESDKLEISNEPLDIRKLIENVNHMSSSLADTMNVDFETEVGDITNPYVYIDELHANEVLINLTSNALKYTAAGGRVRFRVNQISPEIDGKVIFRFDVEDNGIGMSEEFQQHLFEAFAREKTSTVSKMQGAGLGLSIVKRIVDLAGGSIRVKSKQNVGSTFTVEMPMRVMTEDAIQKYEDDNKANTFNKEKFSLENKKVLLVEDNEMNREIAVEILEDAGMIVDTAEGGMAAVKAIEENGVDCYDIILMDIQMPDLDGYETTKMIRALPSGDRVTIIALSANAFEEDIRKSLAIGMNAHVAKPIDKNVLFETIKKLSL
ncbi:MAG: response regulator [Lachnospiraceae bacterium]|nr:response regulator [Candidatus Colinaster equi]